MKVRLFIVVILICSMQNVGAEWSANIGYSSDYVFRGVVQEPSSAFVGIDYESDGLYAGTWLGDVGDGFETDIYFGYQGTAGNIGYLIGYTGYFYTEDFDDTYQEINVSGSYRIASIELAIGRYDNFSGPTQDYIHYGLVLSHQGFYGKLGGYAQDLSGNYVEIGYGFQINRFSVLLAATFADADLTGESDETLALTISRRFSLSMN